MPVIWSNTDYPYECLKDVERTKAFAQALQSCIKPGDIVVDGGSGSGILALFAAKAGAKKVYAVEIEASLIKALYQTIALNGYQDIIEVVPGDITEVNLPQSVNVFVGELIDTGLMEEMQVPVINALRDKGVINDQTILIPYFYTTQADLVAVDDIYYGFHIAAPKQEWPHYNRGLDTSWHSTKVTPLTAKVTVVEVDLRHNNPIHVSAQIVFTPTQDGIANALRISGILGLTESIDLRDTNAVNGDQIFTLDQPLSLQVGQDVIFNLSFDMGEGVKTLNIKQLS